MILNSRNALSPCMRPRYLALAIWKRLMKPTLCSAALRKWLCRRLRFLARSDMAPKGGFFSGASIWAQPCMQEYRVNTQYIYPVNYPGIPSNIRAGKPSDANTSFTQSRSRPHSPWDRGLPGRPCPRGRCRSASARQAGTTPTGCCRRWSQSAGPRSTRSRR